ncbi:hypothetical protein ACQ4LE_009593 [Meloidogyne hapla]
MPNLLEEISKLLDCTQESVHSKLSNKKERDQVLNHIKGKALKTTYFNRCGNKQIIYCDGISLGGSHQILAYGNLRAPFNISVCAYFHARHRITLKYPFHQCVQFKNCYYPLELLEFCPLNSGSDSDCPINMRNLRTQDTSESVKSLDSCSTDSTFKASSSNEKTPEHTIRRGILWLYENDKKSWEKHDITLFHSK